MKPKRPENEESQLELMRPRLESFIDLNHRLVRLSKKMRWQEFDLQFGSQFGDRGQPALSTRLVVALTYLKHMWNLSDEEMSFRNVGSG